MRIGVLGQKRVPSREGGVEKTVEQIGARLAERGHEVILFNRSGHNIYGSEFDIPSTGRYKNMDLISVFCPRSGFGTFIYAFNATVKALLRGCRVMIFNGSGSCNMIPFAKAAGATVIAFIHGIDSHRAKWGKVARAVLRRGEIIAAKKADACLVLSQKDMNYMKGLGSENTVMITNGADAPAVGSDTGILKRLGLKGGKYVLSVNRLVPEKRIELLINAFTGMDSDAKLVIVGGEESGGSDYYNGLIKAADSDPRIVFTGFIDSEPELNDLYRNCGCFVLPSDMEGMSNSLLEAMSRGCLCVVSDIEENTSVISDYGLVFRKGDVDDLLLKLGEALETRRSPTCIQQQVAFTMNRYSWDKCTDRIESEIIRIAGRHAD